MVLLTGKLLCVLGESSLGQGSIISTPNFMGGQLSWLERLVYTQEVTGSSPVPPTITRYSVYGLVFIHSFKQKRLIQQFFFIMLTVNLLTIKTSLVISGSSSDGRTPDLGSGGRRFKSCLSDHIQPCSVMVTRRTLTPSLLVRPQPGLPTRCLPWV